MNNPVFLHMLIIFGSLVLLILLAIFIPAILMIRKTMQQRRERDWLHQHGTRITAYVKYVILQGGESEQKIVMAHPALLHYRSQHRKISRHA